MNFIRKDLTRFWLAKSERCVGSEGDVTRVYNEPSGEFWGNIQPAGSDRTYESAGMFENGRYLIYTKSKLPFSQFDKVGCREGEYLVRAAAKRKEYTLLLVIDSLEGGEGDDYS